MSGLLPMAEREGFEPSVPCGTPDFESCMRNPLIGKRLDKSVRMLCITGTQRIKSDKFPRTLPALTATTLTLEG